MGSRSPIHVRMNPRICVCNNRGRRRRRRRRIGAIGVRTRRVTSGSEVSHLNGEKDCERVELSLTKRKENKQTNKKKKRFSVYVRLCSCRLPRRYRVCLKKRNDKKKEKPQKLIVIALTNCYRSRTIVVETRVGGRTERGFFSSMGPRMRRAA